MPGKCADMEPHSSLHQKRGRLRLCVNDFFPQVALTDPSGIFQGAMRADGSQRASKRSPTKAIDPSPLLIEVQMKDAPLQAGRLFFVCFGRSPLGKGSCAALIEKSASHETHNQHARTP